MTCHDLIFSDKVVVVAGGTSGINFGVAKEFASAGAKVGVLSRSVEKVEAAVAQLQEITPHAAGSSADVRDSAAVAAAFSEFAEKLGPFDVLVSGAAGNFPAKAADMSPNGFAAVVNINLLGTCHVLRAAYPHLIKPGSSVINISAPQAYVPMPLQSHACAAKAGVDMITKTLALEWAGDGIRINSIVPGPIGNTEAMRRLAPTQALIDDVAASVPLKRLGQCEVIACTAMFLASPLAACITGVILPVDGGWSLGGVSDLAAGLARQMEKAPAA